MWETHTKSGGVSIIAHFFLPAFVQLTEYLCLGTLMQKTKTCLFTPGWEDLGHTCWLVKNQSQGSSVRSHVCFVCFSEDIVEFLYVRGFIRPLPSKHVSEDCVRIKGGWVHESLVLWTNVCCRMISEQYVHGSLREVGDLVFKNFFGEGDVLCFTDPGEPWQLGFYWACGYWWSQGAGSEAAENFVFCWVRASLHSLQRHLLYPGLIWLLCLTTECPEGARGGWPQSGHHWGPRSHLAKEDSKGKTQVTHSWETTSTAFSHLLYDECRQLFRGNSRERPPSQYEWCWWFFFLASVCFSKGDHFPLLWKLQAVPLCGHAENCREMIPHLCLSFFLPSLLASLSPSFLCPPAASWAVFSFKEKKFMYLTVSVLVEARGIFSCSM